MSSDQRAAQVTGDVRNESSGCEMELPSPITSGGPEKGREQSVQGDRARSRGIPRPGGDITVNQSERERSSENGEENEARGRS